MMKRLLLCLIALCLSTGQPVYAGYEAVVLTQLPQYVQVHDVAGMANWPNPAAQVMPVGLFCKPDDFARHSADAAKRTVVIRSEAGTLSTSQVLAICPKLLDAKYTKLLAAAQAQEAKSISGVGLSLLALGVSQQKPKALACAVWSQSLWSLYYNRKAIISVDLEAEPDLDFSSLGEMPYTMPELSVEAWGTAP
jgi:hypothetical protein